MVVSCTVAGVISQHWSKNLKYKLTVACPNINESSFFVSHGLYSLPRYNHPFPEHIVHCDHVCHKPDLQNTTLYEVDLETFKRFWFHEQKTAYQNSASYSLSLRPILKGIEDGHGTVMISYSWGTKDINTDTFPNQEVVKKIAAGLEDRGFSVWLDVRYMCGDMIAKAATVISNCLAVIACITNEYHQRKSYAYREFVFACSIDKPIFGIKLTTETNMLGGAYGFMKPQDKYYDVSMCGTSQRSFNKVLDELVADLLASGIVRKKT
ncbi:hypothetical protein HK096_004716 [Nowakowskiella sp. JEL0078]|nr:hypothetical protein HK096_004716 [Nowakowskiella sp. JEL0078]